MTAARQGGVLGRLLVILVVVSLSGALAWATLANHRAHGTWSFHPLDPAWWSPTPRDPTAGDPFASVAEDAKRLAGQAGEAVWGTGGLIERGEAWWRERGQPPPTAPAPVSPPASAPDVQPAPASVRGLLEQRFAVSEQRFASGLELAKQARPSLTDDATTLAGRMKTLTEARSRFAEVERDLGEAIPAYEAIPGHDPVRLANAKQLQGFARQMQELTRLTP